MISSSGHAGFTGDILLSTLAYVASCVSTLELCMEGDMGLWTSG